MSPNLPFAILAVGAGVSLIVIAILLHARALDGRLPPPPRRPWWEGRRRPAVEPAESDLEPRPKPAAGEGPRISTPAHRRVFNPGRFG